MKNTFFVDFFRLARSLILAGCGFALGGCAATNSTWQATDRFLHDVTVVDVVEAVAIPHQTLVIRDQQILAVRDADTVSLPNDAQVIWSGGFVMPGLWDMHVHALSDADDALVRALPLFIANGIVGVRDMGSLMPGITDTRARLGAEPSRSAPDLYVAGPLLDGVKLQWYGELPLVLDDAQSAQRELPKLIAQGVDFFKVYDKLGKVAYDAVLEYAARNSVPVAGHATDTAGLLGGAQAGQSTIEHLSVFSLRECVAESKAWFDRALGAKFSGDYTDYYRTVIDFFTAVDQQRCDQAYDAMAEAGTFFTPTLVMEFNDRGRVDQNALLYLPPGSANWCEQLLATIDNADPAMRDEAYAAFGVQLKRMRDAGVRILAGSDTQNNCLVPGASLHWELQQLVEAGLRPIDAIRAATTNAAVAMGRQEDLGQIQPGYRADLLVLGANPLQRIEHTRDIRGVLHSGRWYDQKALGRLREEVAMALAESRNRPVE